MKNLTPEQVVKATKLNPLVECIMLAVEAGEVPFVQGQPAIGKSAQIAEVARQLNLKLIDIRLTGLDQTDIQGLPNFVEHVNANGVTVKRTDYIPNNLFPLANVGDEYKLQKLDKTGTPVKDANGNIALYDGFLVLLDEFPDASDEVQAACYQLLLDRKVGQYDLHPNVAIVCAGNKPEDGALASPISTALRSRVITLEATIDKDAWFEWAISNNIDSRILSYLRWKPEMLHSFNAKDTTNPFPAPRTWEKLSNILYTEQGKYTEFAHTLALGLIGKIAVEFKAFLAYYSKLPSIEAILKDPKNADMPKEIAHVYALTGVIAQELLTATPKQIEGLMDYTERMSPEYQVVTVSQATKRKHALIANPQVRAWVVKNAKPLTAAVI